MWPCRPRTAVLTLRGVQLLKSVRLRGTQVVRSILVARTGPMGVGLGAVIQVYM